MSTITLQDAQAGLADVIHSLAPGEGIAITENNRTVAHLVASVSLSEQSSPARPQVTGVPKAGKWKGLLVVPDDFDEPLDELREYME